MESSNPEGVALPPPPAIIPPNVVPIVSEEKRLELMKKASNPKRVPMARPGIGSKGQKDSTSNQPFQSGSEQIDMLYEDGTPVGEKGIGRKVLDKVKETYGSELGHKEFAYDGEKSLFTVGSLPRNRLDFVIVLDDISSIRRTGSAGGSSNPTDSAGDRKRVKKQYQSKTLKVQVNFATKIPMQAIVNALRGQDSEHFQEAVRVLDIVLRQNAAKQGCLLVRQSFFHNNQSFKTLGGGVQSCSGFHSSFRATQGGLSLNMDVSTTMIVKPGSVLDFLLENQNVKNNDQIDWIKAKRMLKNLRITAHPSNMEYRITGLSEKPCKEQRFFLKTKNGQDGDGEEITVFDYFAVYKNLPVRKSADFPCINVGKPKRPSYFPVEFCDLVSLQRYTKALSSTQRALLVEQSRKSPQEQMTVLRNVLKTSKYNADLMLRSSGISIGAEFVQVEGRVLPAPKLQVGNGQEFFPRNGRWNFNNKTLVEPVKIGRWAIVNFSARCDIRYLVNSMLKCAEMKGITIENPLFVFEENYQNRRYPAHVRVEKMFDDISSEPEPRLLLCILPERKNSDIYGPWKRRNLSELGIVTQCIAPTKLNDQYITNVLLKINAKLGGMNSLLTVEHSPSIHLVSKCPTLILGMDVSHGSPGRSDVPSIAAVVSSRNWPSISHYRAAVRTQSPRVEMIASLFKPVSDKVDDGIIRELLHDFYSSSKGRKPDQIIIFRDGVSESQFNQVLNVELDQIIQACKFLDENWSPKFMVIVAQKNHHTKFFQTRSPENVPPGTIIDNTVCHPKNNDFYLCAHAGMIGTTRPAHYHVLYDELGFSADNVQELVHSLSYVYQRSTTAVSVVAPICYAHLAAAQISQFIKFDDMSETSSSHAGGVAVPELPRLAPNVINSMYFC